MDIIERAARALSAYENSGDERSWVYWQSQASAVLTAIREPDEGMIEAGREWAKQNGPLLKGIWQAMIDEALREK
jgi:hypothetical protein